MKRIFILISLMAAAFGAAAQDAEYQLIRRHYTLNDDGSIDIRFRKEIKLLRNRAITAYADKGETFILYNPATDRLTINESYTIRKDGSRVQTPQNAFIDQLPSSCENCGRYNRLRERVVVHTALEYDCIVVLDYTIHREPYIGMGPTGEFEQPAYLEERLQMEQDCPVKKYEIIVDAPESKFKLQWAHFNPSKRTVLDDSHRYHVVYTDLPQTYNDAYLPEADLLYNTLYFTLGTEPAADELIERVPAADNLLVELFNKEPLAYATAIRDYVYDYIRTNDIPPSLLSYRVSSAQETFTSGCGTPDDKLNLLLALLHQANFSADRDQVEGVVVNIDSHPYHLSLQSKNRPAPTVTDNLEEPLPDLTTLLWEGNPIGGGFKQMALPAPEQQLTIDPKRLTSVRTAPMKVPSYSCSNHYKLVLPRTPKHTLVNGPVQISRKMIGVGSIEISIRQLDDGSIDIVRRLRLFPSRGVVSGKAYQFVRQMLIDWDTYNTITIKAAPGHPVGQ